MRFALKLAVAMIALQQPFDLAMNVTISNEQVFIGNAQTFLGYPAAASGGCTTIYQCMGLLCTLTQAACAPAPVSITGQCQGLLCSITYP